MQRASRMLLFGSNLFLKIATGLKWNTLLTGNSPICIPHYRFHFRSTEFADKPYS